MSEKKMLAQYAQVEQPVNVDPSIVHCQICGNPSIAMGENGGEATPCEHQAFMYVGEIGEFTYKSDDFCQRIKNDEFEDENNVDDDRYGIKKVLADAGYDNKMLVIELTYGGMTSCGPTWYTVICGFDYGTLKPIAESD